MLHDAAVRGGWHCVVQVEAFVNSVVLLALVIRAETCAADIGADTLHVLTLLHQDMLAHVLVKYELLHVGCVQLVPLVLAL